MKALSRSPQLEKILELTKLESWQEDKETVEQVQKLGKVLWFEKRKSKDSKKIAVYHEDRIMVTGTADELSGVTGLSKATIWRRAKKMNVDSKGRKFAYV